MPMPNIGAVSPSKLIYVHLFVTTSPQRIHNQISRGTATIFDNGIAAQTTGGQPPKDNPAYVLTSSQWQYLMLYYRNSKMAKRNFHGLKPPAWFG